VMVPAVGQGALAIETRLEESDVVAACRNLNDHATSRCVAAERALLASLGGGCQVPIGAHAVVEGSMLTLNAVVISPAGGKPFRQEASGGVDEAERIGRETGEALLADGAAEVLEEVYGA